MNQLCDLRPEHQQHLMEHGREYHVLTDPYTGKEYIIFMGEKIEYRSITNAVFLQG